MSQSLIYRSAAGYELLMRALYGRNYAARMRSVAAEVPDRASVVELCCGPATLYRRYLRGRVSSYVGLDVNAGFVAHLQRAGVEARQVDLATTDEPLPTADIVLMQASLYHFLPDAVPLLDRMLAAARDRVIISEPIRNIASSTNPLLRVLGRRGTDPGAGGHDHRFTEQTLDELLARYATRVRRSFLIPGGREKVYVLAGG